MSVLEGKGLTKKYGKRVVVNNISLSIKKGDIVGLLGPNGAGKTTTFYMMMGLIKPNKGKVFLNGKEITRMSVPQRARLGIGYLAQEPSIFRKLTVKENLLLVLENRNLPKKVRNEMANHLMEKFGLTALKDILGFNLSGGERRKVEIARALALQPSFLLLDEPFTGVDPLAIEDLKETILRLRQEEGVGILLTDHNVRDTLTITDRVFIMAMGKILISGSSREVAENPVAKEYYLGKKFRIPEELLESASYESGEGESIPPNHTTQP
ncbi:MAG: LPS export ABC transporter ATP-binding protein [bacterium JZ-2024 1]